MTELPRPKYTLRLRMWDTWHHAKLRFIHLRFKASEKLLDLAVLVEPKSGEEGVYELMKKALPGATEEELRKRAKEFVASMEASLKAFQEKNKERN